MCDLLRPGVALDCPARAEERAPGPVPPVRSRGEGPPSATRPGAGVRLVRPQARPPRRTSSTASETGRPHPVRCVPSSTVDAHAVPRVRWPHPQARSPPVCDVLATPECPHPVGRPHRRRARRGVSPVVGGGRPRSGPCTRRPEARGGGRRRRRRPRPRGRDVGRPFGGRGGRVTMYRHSDAVRRQRPPVIAASAPRTAEHRPDGTRPPSATTSASCAKQATPQVNRFRGCASEGRRENGPATPPTKVVSVLTCAEGSCDSP